MLDIRNFNIKNSYSEIFLGITLNCKSKFNNHIKELYKKATRKSNTLFRIIPYMYISTGNNAHERQLNRSFITDP